MITTEATVTPEVTGRYRILASTIASAFNRLSITSAYHSVNGSWERRPNGNKIKLYVDLGHMSSLTINRTTPFAQLLLPKDRILEGGLAVTFTGTDNVPHQYAFGNSKYTYKEMGSFSFGSGIEKIREINGLEYLASDSEGWDWVIQKYRVSLAALSA